MQNVLDAIVIPYADEIRGNITLLSKIKSADISWSSSNPAVISDMDSGLMKAGVVTRGNEDTKVILTATITLNGETAEKKIEVTVLKAPLPVTEDDYAGYLFGHFLVATDLSIHNRGGWVKNEQGYYDASTTVLILLLCLARCIIFFPMKITTKQLMKLLG